MAAVPLFRDTDIATVTSRENALIMHELDSSSERSDFSEFLRDESEELHLYANPPGFKSTLIDTKLLKRNTHASP